MQESNVQCSNLINNGDIAFLCLDCQTQSQQILCRQCFLNSDHINHQYLPTISVEGQCDCGHIGEQLICFKHKNQHATGHIQLEIFDQLQTELIKLIQGERSMYIEQNVSPQMIQQIGVLLCMPLKQTDISDLTKVTQTLEKECLMYELLDQIVLNPYQEVLLHTISIDFVVNFGMSLLMTFSELQFRYKNQFQQRLLIQSLSSNINQVVIKLLTNKYSEICEQFVFNLKQFELQNVLEFLQNFIFLKNHSVWKYMLENHTKILYNLCNIQKYLVQNFLVNLNEKHENQQTFSLRLQEFSIIFEGIFRFAQAIKIPNNVIISHQVKYILRDCYQILAELQIEIFQFGLYPLNYIHWLLLQLDQMNILKLTEFRQLCIEQSVLTFDLFNKQFLHLPLYQLINYIVVKFHKYASYNQEDIGDYFDESYQNATLTMSWLQHLYLVQQIIIILGCQKILEELEIEDDIKLKLIIILNFAQDSSQVLSTLQCKLKNSSIYSLIQYGYDVYYTFNELRLCKYDSNTRINSALLFNDIQLNTAQNIIVECLICKDILINYWNHRNQLLKKDLFYIASLLQVLNETPKQQSNTFTKQLYLKYKQNQQQTSTQTLQIQQLDTNEMSSESELCCYCHQQLQNNDIICIPLEYKTQMFGLKVPHICQHKYHDKCLQQDTNCMICQTHCDKKIQQGKNGKLILNQFETILQILKANVSNEYYLKYFIQYQYYCQHTNSNQNIINIDDCKNLIKLAENPYLHYFNDLPCKQCEKVTSVKNNQQFYSGVNKLKFLKF
ncbi:Putative_zinc finger in N-recognin (UBR box) domain-containing protein [Hexamita inflata]|uniref:Putative_zinc finger in N-recognin (UBR box) domain-containing protein n=1 Tax=Hexamita inflata TaxID=28002 RepID=A0ABP1IIQ0_9EUKA